jgi:hypothetical protein
MNSEFNNLQTTSKYIIAHTSLIENSIYFIEIIYELDRKKCMCSLNKEELRVEKSITTQKKYFNNKKYYLYECEINLSNLIFNNIPQKVLKYDIKIYTHDTSAKTIIYNINESF